MPVMLWCICPIYYISETTPLKPLLQRKISEMLCSIIRLQFDIQIQKEIYQLLIYLLKLVISTNEEFVFKKLQDDSYFHTLASENHHFQL